MPLYLAGARMITNYPTSIAVHGLALNVTVQTYNQSLDIGLMACGEALPETAELAAYVEAAFMEFQALQVAEVVDEAPAPKKPAARKSPARKAAPKPKAAAKVVTQATPRPRASTPRKKAVAG